MPRLTAPITPGRKCCEIYMAGDWQCRKHVSFRAENCHRPATINRKAPRNILDEIIIGESKAARVRPHCATVAAMLNKVQINIYPAANQIALAKGLFCLDAFAPILLNIITLRMAVGTIMPIIMIAHITNIIMKSFGLHGLIPILSCALIPIVDMFRAISMRNIQLKTTMAPNAVQRSNLSLCASVTIKS